MLYGMGGSTCSEGFHIEQVFKNSLDLLLKDSCSNYKPTHAMVHVCKFQPRKQDVRTLYNRPEVGQDYVQHRTLS